MATSASEIITLAQNTKALSKEQLERIVHLAPGMSQADLEKVKTTLEKLQSKTKENQESELLVRKQVASKYMEWKSDKSRTDLQTQEAPSQKNDSAQAEALIQTI